MPKKTSSGTTKRKPNILITGTPGVGKSTICKRLAHVLKLKHVEISRSIRKRHLFKEWDDANNCSIFDEKMVRQYVKPKLKEGGFIFDFHCPHIFKRYKRYIDHCVVLVIHDTSVLYERLEARGYSSDKCRLNVEAEIFQAVREDATQIFGDPLLLENSDPHLLKENLRKIKGLLIAG